MFCDVKVLNILHLNKSAKYLIIVLFSFCYCVSACQGAMLKDSVFPPKSGFFLATVAFLVIKFWMFAKHLGTILIIADTM